MNRSPPVDRQKLKFNSRADVLCDLTDDEYAITALADFLQHSPGAFATVADVTLKEQLYNYLPEKSRHVSLPLALLDVIARYPHILQVVTCSKPDCHHVKLASWACVDKHGSKNASVSTLVNDRDDDALRAKLRQTVKLDTTVELGEFLELFQLLWGHALTDAKAPQQQRKKQKPGKKANNDPQPASSGQSAAVDIIRRLTPECTLFNGLIRFRSDVKPCRLTPFYEQQALLAAISYRLRPQSAFAQFQQVLGTTQSHALLDDTDVFQPVEVDYETSNLSPEQPLPDDLATAMLIHNMLFNTPGLMTRVSTLPKLFEIYYNRRLPDYLLNDAPTTPQDMSPSPAMYADSPTSPTSATSPVRWSSSLTSRGSSGTTGSSGSSSSGSSNRSSNHSYSIAAPATNFNAITQLLRKYNDLFFVRESRYHDCHLDIVGSAFWTTQFICQYSDPATMSHTGFQALLNKNDDERDLKTKLCSLVKTGSRYTGKEIRILYLLIWRHRLQGPVMWDLLKRCGDVLSLDNAKAKGSNVIVSRKERLTRGNPMVVDVSEVVRLELASRRMREMPSTPLSEIFGQVQQQIAASGQTVAAPDVSSRYPLSTFRRPSTSAAPSPQPIVRLQPQPRGRAVPLLQQPPYPSSARRAAAASPTGNRGAGAQSPLYASLQSEHYRQQPMLPFNGPPPPGFALIHPFAMPPHFNVAPAPIRFTVSQTSSDSMQSRNSSQQQSVTPHSPLSARAPSPVDTLVERVSSSGFFRHELGNQQSRPQATAPFVGAGAALGTPLSPFKDDLEDPSLEFEAPPSPPRLIPRLPQANQHQQPVGIAATKLSQYAHLALSSSSLAIYSDVKQTLSALGLDPMAAPPAKRANAVDQPSTAWVNKGPALHTQRLQYPQLLHQPPIETDLFDCFRPATGANPPATWGVSGAARSPTSPTVDLYAREQFDRRPPAGVFSLF
ncbi:hypothetical protein RI367_002306 [Sorochytrium milnesiophthora]